MYRLCKAYVILFIRCHEMHLHCFFFFVFFCLLSIARLMRLDHTERVCWRKFSSMDNALKSFHHDSYVISLSGVVVKWSRRCRVQVRLCTLLFYLLSLFFTVFGLFCLLNCFVVFSINIYLNNCYLVKCNKQKEKHCVSRAKIEY